MPLALSQVRVDSLLGASCPECEVRVEQGESPGFELTCYRETLSHRNKRSARATCHPLVCQILRVGIPPHLTIIDFIGL